MEKGEYERLKISKFKRKKLTGRNPVLYIKKQQQYFFLI